jgi:glycosyltransferase involved in cell wall biosynthesis
MRVSKHHYAAELAKRGNRVFFLNPPDAAAPERFSVSEVADEPGLSTITYRPFVPFAIRFRSRALFNRIAAAHVRWILRRTGVRFDIVWCFDVNLYADLRGFRAPVKIYHPMDQIVQPYQFDVAATADLVVSVSEEILRNVRHYPVPIVRIEHGLAPAFVSLAERRLRDHGYSPSRPLKVGYVGNLLMKFVDAVTILRLIAEHPDIEFHFWGPRIARESNVASSESPESAEFIRSLTESANVVLHGVLAPNILANELEQMDLLLMCYKILEDPNRGCNSHKILEYLSTGRAIVANRVSDYADRPGLLEMLPSADNSQMSQLFAEVIANIDRLNALTSRRVRLEYALANSYASQIGRIEESLASAIAAQS